MQTVGTDAESAGVNRSYLFVPADSERKLAKARDSTADALILDLEDSVAASRRPAARKLVGEFLADRPPHDAWVRINPMTTNDCHLDLQSLIRSAPTGIVLPKPTGATDVVQLSGLLQKLEGENGLRIGQIGIIPIATETPGALFRLHEYTSSTPRLAGMTWGAEDLSAAVGASTARDDAGGWLPQYQMARSLCLFAASAAEVPAIDTVYTDFSDAEGLTEYAANARRDGFEGMLAIHPSQVDVINAAFTPDDADVERAQRIVDLFSANPEAGTLGMDGEMIDRPHWKRAIRVLECAQKHE